MGKIVNAASTPLPAWLVSILMMLPLILVGWGVATDRAEAWNEIRHNKALAEESKQMANENRALIGDQDKMIRWLVWNAGGNPNEIVKKQTP